MTAHALSKQIPNFSFKRQDVSQEGFNTFVHWFPHLAAWRKRRGAGMANDSAVWRAARLIF
jgi:hypothetical protein